MDDIPDLVSSTVHLCADDVLLYTVVNYVEDCVRLQHDLKNYTDLLKLGKFNLASLKINVTLHDLPTKDTS